MHQFGYTSPTTGHCVIPDFIKSGWYCPHPKDRFRGKKYRKDGLYASAYIGSVSTKRTKRSNSGVPTGGGSATVTPSVSATQVSGPAPLAVVFDATATTSTAVTDTFRQVTYTHNYGDSGATAYSYGNSANLGRTVDVGGAIGAHVYDTPGTYTYTLTANDGTTANATITITVDNPDTYWTTGGRVTRYVIASGSDFSQATLAANGTTVFHQTSSSVLTPAANTRYLYRRGDSFTGTWTPTRSSASTRIHLGAFGSGAKPFIPTVMPVNNFSAPTSSETWPTNITITEIGSNEILQYGSTTNYLVHRCDIVSPTAGGILKIMIGGSIDYWKAGGSGASNAALYWPKGVVVSECTVTGSAAQTQSYLIWMEGATQSAVIGNYTSTAHQHNMRGFMDRSIIAHNEMRGISNDGTLHSLKLHGRGPDSYNDMVSASMSPRVRMVVVANNLMGHSTDNNRWPMAVCPENNDVTTNEGVDDVMIENNVGARGSNWQLDIAVCGRRITYIGNTALVGGGAASVSQRSDRVIGLPSDGTSSEAPSYSSTRS